MAIAALILGICSLVFSWFSIWGFLLGWVPIALGITGAILGGVGMKRDPEKAGMATTGMVLAIVGLSISLIWTIGCHACICAEANRLRRYGYYVRTLY